MARWALDTRTGKLTPFEEAVAPVAPPPPAPSVDVSGLAEWLQTRSEKASRLSFVGDLAFSFLASTSVAAANWIWGFPVLAEWVVTPGEHAVLAAGTMSGILALIRLRSFALDALDTLAYHRRKAAQSRAWADAWHQQQATRRTIERRRMAEVAVREVEATTRMVEVNRVRREQGNQEANRRLYNEGKLREVLAETYADGPGKRWAGGQPFSQKRVGPAWFTELQRIGAIELAGRHPQWRFDEMGQTADEALETVLFKSPNFLGLTFEG